MGPRDAAAMARIDAAQQQYQVQKEKYERLRSDVTIKLKFLEENKVGVPSLKRRWPLGLSKPERSDLTLECHSALTVVFPR